MPHYPPETTEAVAAQVQSRVARRGADGGQGDAAGAETGGRYTLGRQLLRGAATPYRRSDRDPLYRPLRIFSIDPATHRLDGAVATVNVPYEPLAPGPRGALFEVDNGDESTGQNYRQANLDEHRVLMEDGYAPSLADPRFHQQMVYAVCSNVYAGFRLALGRDLSWGFGEDGTVGRLRIKPHYKEEANAYYWTDGRQGELRFGYFRASDHPTDNSLPGGFVFTCLSHDIVSHELTHALLDGLRPNFRIPSGTDVLGFHEGFADLVAVFQHFSYPEIVRTAIRRSRGMLRQADLLTELGHQFGYAAGRARPLRDVVEGAEPTTYHPGMEAHDMGLLLVRAVVEAFITVFERKTRQYVRLASGGTGVLAPGELPYDLQTILAEKASQLAGQFLGICIRAIDYCPPVGITLGDYLRALITADHGLVPDDPWDYRGALVEAFRRRNIYPRSVPNLAPDALLWRGPRMALPPVPGLDFASLRFQGDPSRSPAAEELRRQAICLGSYAVVPERLEEFGLVANGDPRLMGDRVSIPRIESVRIARRAGPDRQIVYDLVAEITQVRHVEACAEGPGFDYPGGSTIILGPEGEMRYVVIKSVVGAGRLERRRDFLASDHAKRYWKIVGDRAVPVEDLFRLLDSSGGGHPD